MIKLKKPFALGEVGPRTPNGSFDSSLWYWFIHKENGILIYLFLFRANAIQNYFNLVSYFHAWNGMWSPIREKNAYALYNNPHVVNGDQI